MRTLLTIALVVCATAASAQQLSRQQMMTLRTACETDLKTLCAGIQFGNGRLAQCLRDNAASVSQPCKDQLLALQAARQSN
ncbi:cysteine rich repeat-containing protein [Pleomorphomonas sp. NRK KF1]|uniref:cysteine rich repeat-containing protein n=1 Tax=Pleomorphomonas sp. NRK KF1 TaxID=2943000 RepID=UPI002044973A|nr:cysteine rich repeat-containing protein [Pleomorphomonas sp. NRK KF1]MCM5554126.1 cysteine rich repeat-containing protein [Pleomorphomonas sp. NRK KF1]